MAIAALNKVTIVVPVAERERVLRLLQAFQNLEIIPHVDDDVTAAEFAPDNEERELLNDALSEILRAQSLLSTWFSESMVEKFRIGRPEMTLSDLEETVQKSPWQDVCRKALSLEKELDTVRSRRSELRRLIESWSPWRVLSFSPQKESKAFRYTRAIAGSFPIRLYSAFPKAFAEETGGLGVIQELFKTSDRVGVVLFFPVGMAETAEDIARRYDFSELDFPYRDVPQAALAEWEKEEEALTEKEKELLSDLEALGEKKPALDLAEEFYRTLLLRSDARRQAYQSKATFFLEGWIEADHTENLRTLLKKEISSPYYVSFSDVEEKDIPKAPTKLKNNRLFSAFETLTEMYSIPTYDDIDPTPVTSAFYLVFFGMMVADMGYGAVLLLATFLAKRLLKLERGLAKSIDFFFYLSFPIIGWGLIYGSLFGIELPFALLSTSNDIITILLLSVAFGWLQIVTGQIMSVYTSLRKKDVLGALSGGAVWALLLVGLVVLVVSKLVWKSPALFFLAVALCAVAVLGIVFLPVIESKNARVKGFLKGLYALYGVTSYIGDLVSYSRLMALGIAGASISVAFNTIISSLPFVARITLGALLAIALHALNLFLSMLSAYVHGIRLQYVEFFSKFYNGGGRKFSPFKTAEKHIYLIEEHAQSQNSHSR